MRMLAQDATPYRKPRVDGTDDPEALRRLRIVEGVDLVDLMRGQFTPAEAAEAFGVSRATYCEWRSGPERREAAGPGRTAAGGGRRRTPGRCSARVVCPLTRRQCAKVFSTATAHVECWSQYRGELTCAARRV